MTIRRLYTIGYEKALQRDVLTALTEAGVATLIDVRADLTPAGFFEAPARRRNRRRRDALRSSKGAGDAAGGPPRQPAPRMGSVWGIVEEKLARPEAELDFRQAADIANAAPSCLLCYEADWRVCHRSRIAELLVQGHGFAVRHLAPKTL